MAKNESSWLHKSQHVGVKISFRTEDSLVLQMCKGSKTVIHNHLRRFENVDQFKTLNSEIKETVSVLKKTKC